MNAHDSHGPTPTPSKDQASDRGRDGRKAAHYDHTASNDKASAESATRGVAP